MTRREEYVQEHWNNYKASYRKYSAIIKKGKDIMEEGEKMKLNPEVLWSCGVAEVVRGRHVVEDAQRELSLCEESFRQACISAYGPEHGILLWESGKDEAEVAGIHYK